MTDPHPTDPLLARMRIDLTGIGVATNVRDAYAEFFRPIIRAWWDAEVATHTLLDTALRERNEAEAMLDAARALHTQRIDGRSRTVTKCGCCGEAWPCETATALGMETR